MNHIYFEILLLEGWEAFHFYCICDDIRSPHTTVFCVSGWTQATHPSSLKEPRTQARRMQTGHKKQTNKQTNKKKHLKILQCHSKGEP